nr:MAG TPA: hypothetical protein [Crassvirales sp.]
MLSAPKPIITPPTTCFQRLLSLSHFQIFFMSYSFFKFHITKVLKVIIK